MTSGPFELRVVPYDHPDAVALIDQLQQFYLDRYGGTDDTPVDPAEFAPPRGLFFVAYDGSGDASAPVGCAGWRTHAGNPLLRDSDVEIKRMYVVPSARGRGYARRLLDALERTAREAGHKRVVLETGIEQPEAIRFYQRNGYTPIEPFGFHHDDPRVRCFAKELA